MLGPFDVCGQGVTGEPQRRDQSARRRAGGVPFHAMTAARRLRFPERRKRRRDASTSDVRPIDHSVTEAGETAIRIKDGR